MKGKINIKKKLITIFFAVTLLITALPAHTNAEECIEHQWGDWITEEATCSMYGYKTRVCAICDISEREEIPPTNEHDWEDWKTIEEATCSMYGYRIRECTLCHTSEREGIPPTNEHDWGEWETSYKPTCGTTGYKSRICNVCHEEEEETIPKTEEHSWGKWETTKKTTALSEGKQSRFCSECDKKETKNVPKLKAKVTLKNSSVTMEGNKIYTLKIKSKTYGDKIAKWSSSNNKIATVNSKGKVTGKKEGTATITLKMKSGVCASCKVKVTKPKQSNNATSKSNNNNNSPKSNNNNATLPSSGYVWIPNTGSKYHKTSTCSGMKNPREVTVKEAINAGYEPCSKCY